MINWSQADFDAHMQKIRGHDVDKPAKKPVPRGMNKLESEYSSLLRSAKQVGDIVSYAYEAITLKLAYGVRYTPDFFVETLTSLEFHETKGFMRDDARVKLHVAAKMFPQFRFYLCRKKLVRDGGGWDIQIMENK